MNSDGMMNNINGNTSSTGSRAASLQRLHPFSPQIDRDGAQHLAQRRAYCIDWPSMVASGGAFDPGRSPKRLKPRGVGQHQQFVEQLCQGNGNGGLEWRISLLTAQRAFQCHSRLAAHHQ